jgi:putative transposase
MAKTNRTWSPEEKLAIIKEAEREGVSITCRKYGVYPSLFYKWKERLDIEGVDGLKPKYVIRNDRAMTQLQNENNRLKKLLAEKELELQLKTELFKKKTQQWKSANR